MNNQSVPEDVYAGWTKARFDLLRESVGRVYALLAVTRADDEDWRTALAAETFLWRAIRDAEKLARSTFVAAYRVMNSGG